MHPKPTLKIAYAKIAILAGTYHQILYDSATNSLSLTTSASTLGRKGKTNLKQAQSLAQSRRRISNNDREKLVQSLLRDGFFQADVFYSPDPTKSHDYTLIVLAANLDGRMRTVIWTDISKNVPPGLASIEETIRRIASE